MNQTRKLVQELLYSAKENKLKDVERQAKRLLKKKEITCDDAYKLAELHDKRISRAGR